MKFSIVVVTYKPDIDKLKLTLKSILRQTYTDYEIVISDDGSENNQFDEIRDYFQKNGFDRYKLVEHNENQGTVKNLISAVEHCEGEYVRDFGPGDMFYAEDTLAKLADFLDSNKADICFGLMRGYKILDNGKIEYETFPHPFDIEAYRDDNKKRILKNLVLYSDNASGACTVYKKEIYNRYLKKIESYVIYEEDIFQVLAALEGNFATLYDDYLVWYEVDTGVSTEKNSKFKMALKKDVDRFYNMLFERFPENKYVKKRKRVSCFYKINNLYARSLLRMFVNPDAIRYVISAFVQRKGKKHCVQSDTQGFLDEDDFLGVN